jgi:TonB-linked SusC/RagA family outer membrane protein
MQIFAQGVTITGKVTDGNTGEPLPGVNLILAGTTTGTITDVDGNFSLNVPDENAQIVFSFVGYVSETIDLEGRTTLNVVLIPDILSLEEIVVIGYGAIKKADLTGAVASVSQEDIASTKAVDALQAIQGKVAGLDLYQETGEAGSDVSITLRGLRSFGDQGAENSPLILVDGVEYGNGLDYDNRYRDGLDLNPSDIESIDILKDAASTAIYGTRGANGVILITTKKGKKEGKTVVTFNSYISYNVPSYVPDIMTGQQFVQKLLERRIADKENDMYDDMDIDYDDETGEVEWDMAAYPSPWEVFGSVTMQDLYDEAIEDDVDIFDENGNPVPHYLVTTDPTARALLDSNVSLDYLDMMLRNTITDNYELGIFGGREKTSVSFSLGLMNDRGLLKNDQLRRYNIRLGLDHDLTDRMSLGANILYTRKFHDRRNSGIFNQGLKTGPIGNFRNPDGSLNQFPDAEFTFNQPNPFLDEEPDGSYVNEILYNRIFGSIYYNWELLKGLTFNTNYGVDLGFIREGLYRGPQTLERYQVATAETNMRQTNTWEYTWDNTLTYLKDIGIHNFQFLLGQSVRAEAREHYSMTGIGQQVPITQFYAWSDFTSTVSSSSYRQEQLLSFFGRINYKINEKYLFQATLRADGSSVLAEGNKWGYFPSASAGWRLSEEDFLQNISALSILKLRASWGIAGNAAVRAYQTITEVSQVPIFMSLNDETYSSLFPFKIGNEDLKWETTQTYDIGVDIGLFNNRIYGSIDLYMSNTSDLLFESPLPPTSTYTRVTENVAETKNKGIEIQLSTQNIKTSKISWTTDWTFALNRDEIVSLRRGTDEVVATVDNIINIKRVGEPVSAFYDYEFDGMYQISDLQDEFLYVQQQMASGDSIERGLIPMISNGFYPGDIKLKDVNGDGEYTDDEDRVIYNRSPKFTFGLTNNFSFHNFGLNIFFYGRVGQTIDYEFYRAYKPADQDVENGPYVDAWTPENTGALFPRYSTDGNATSFLFNSPLALVDGSFVKIRDITLSYSLPVSILGRLKMSKFKIYVTGKNLFTFSKVDNYDSEREGHMEFPLPKQYIAGVNIEF